MWLITASKSCQQCCFKPVHDFCWPNHVKLGLFKTKTLPVFIKYSLACFLHNQLSRLINPNQGFASTLMTITGTLGWFHNVYSMNCRITVAPQHTWVLESDATQWTVLNMIFWTCAATRVLSCEVWVSCDLQLPTVSATNTCKFDIWEAAWWPQVQSERHRLDNVWLISRPLLYLVYYHLYM